MRPKPPRPTYRPGARHDSHPGTCRSEIFNMSADENEFHEFEDEDLVRALIGEEAS